MFLENQPKSDCCYSFRSIKHETTMVEQNRWLQIHLMTKDVILKNRIVYSKPIILLAKRLREQIRFILMKNIPVGQKLILLPTKPMSTMSLTHRLWTSWI